MKKGLLFAIVLTLVACGVENNINFSTTQGNCADGSTNASYCMAVTIQNNNGGQNYINSTNYPITNLSLSVSGASNVGYPSAQGSSYDPNNCLGSTINPGSSCTFYLWLTGESFGVGTHTPITVNANYTVNNTLPWVTSGNSATSSLTVYETPGLQISSTGSSPAYNGYVQTYNNSGFNTPFKAESENIANAVANDNYYGFLYLAGNSGVYFSGNSNYAGNATGGSSSIKGATNIIISGQTIYGNPNGSLSNSVYTASMQKESFSWTQYATGLTNPTANVSAITGTRLFFANANNAYVCTQNATGNNCSQEGVGINGGNITALGYTTISASSGTVYTGIIAGNAGGLWAESGVIGSPVNSWVSVTTGNGAAIANVIKIVSDVNNNLYIATSTGNFYLFPANGNVSTQTSSLTSFPWTVQNPVALVVDNSGGVIYIATSSGVIYSCPNSTTGAGSCTSIGQSAYTSGILGLNIITQLTSG